MIEPMLDTFGSIRWLVFFILEKIKRLFYTDSINLNESREDIRKEMGEVRAEERTSIRSRTRAAAKTTAKTTDKIAARTGATTAKDTKKRILQVATRLFGEKGFDGTGIREICHEAHTNVSMISYYFGGKQELYNAIIEDVIERQVAFLKRDIDLTSPIETLSSEECKELVYIFMNRMIEFVYTDVSREQIIFLLKEQQGGKLKNVPSPALPFITALLKRIFGNKLTPGQLACQVALLGSQVSAPRILPAFTAGVITYGEKEIEFLKYNMKRYVDCIFSEV